MKALLPAFLALPILIPPSGTHGGWWNTLYPELASFSLGTAIYLTTKPSESQSCKHPALLCTFLALGILILLSSSSFFTKQLLGIFFVCWAAMMWWTGCQWQDKINYRSLGLAIAVSASILCISAYVLYAGDFKGLVGSRNLVANWLACGIAACLLLEDDNG